MDFSDKNAHGGALDVAQEWTRVENASRRDCTSVASVNTRRTRLALGL